MEDLYHVNFSTEDNSSSSNDILWASAGKVQFSGVEDHYGRIDPFYSNLGLFPDEEGYLLSTNQQECHQQPPSYQDYGHLDDNLQFDMVSPPPLLQFGAQYPTLVPPPCDTTKDKPHSTSPLASLELLKSYGKGFKRLRDEDKTMQLVDDDVAVNTKEGVWRKLSTDDVMRIAGTRFIQSSSESECLPFLETHPFGVYFSGLSDEEKEDVELAEFLLACAEKVGHQQFERASKLLSHCESLSCKTGSPVKRVVHYFAEALRQRIDRATGRVSHKDLQKGPSFDPEEASKELNPTIVAYYEELPFCQISLFTAVQAIIDDVAEAKRVHIIDLEIRKGGHWIILMEALEKRHECPIEVLKITALESGTTRDIAEDTGERLKDYAQGLNIPFSFNIVMESDVLDLREDLFEIDPEETIAVYSQFALRTKIQRSDQLEIIMRVIRSFSPSVMVVAEIEANLNSNCFVNRFIEALFFFSAFFDCFETCMKGDEKNRVILESLYISHGIRNIVAAEGAERHTRNVKIDVWRAFFSRYGMVEKEFSNLCLFQAELVAKRFPSGNLCTFDMNGHCLLIGWKGTPINSVSVWKFL